MQNFRRLLMKKYKILMLSLVMLCAGILSASTWSEKRRIYLQTDPNTLYLEKAMSGVRRNFEDFVRASLAIHGVCWDNSNFPIKFDKNYKVDLDHSAHKLAAHVASVAKYIEKGYHPRGVTSCRGFAADVSDYMIGKM